MMMNKEKIFQKISSAPIREKAPVILKLCEEKIVLDVGCVGQYFSHRNSSWLHGKIKAVSRATIGVDVDEGGIEELNGLNYEMFHVDELYKLGKKFEVIVMADVIEHVNDPVGFLNFYSTFLKKDGCVAVTTPNPFNFYQTLKILTSNTITVNLEHTMWLDPKTFTELVDRTDSLYIDDFFWLKPYISAKELKFKDRVIFHIAQLARHIRKYYSPNYIAILRKRP